MTAVLKMLAHKYGKLVLGNVDYKKIDQMTRKRREVYSLSQGQCPSSVAVEESKKYIDLLAHSLKDTDLPNTLYSKILSLVSATGCVPGLKDGAMRDILSYEEISLKELLRQLKKNSNQAGAKVRLVKKSIDEVHQTMESYKA